MKKEGLDIFKRMRVRYVNGTTIPKSIQEGRVLMHNMVRHGSNWECGINGFRAWTATKPFPGFVLCPCGWAGLKHYATKGHVAVWRDPAGRRRIQRWVKAEELRWTKRAKR
jgi:hypothetical protein